MRFEIIIYKIRWIRVQANCKSSKMKKSDRSWVWEGPLLSIKINMSCSVKHVNEHQQIQWIHSHNSIERSALQLFSCECDNILKQSLFVWTNHNTQTQHKQKYRQNISNRVIVLHYKDRHDWPNCKPKRDRYRSLYSAHWTLENGFEAQIHGFF